MSSTKPRIAVIIGTTRPTRWGAKPAEWIRAKIESDGRMSAEILDIADFDLPFFDEAASNRWMPSKSPAAVKWQKTLAGFDGFVFVTAEYNHSISGALKNALDQAYNEWNRKPAAVVGYGGVGAARAAQHLREIAVELKMVNIVPGVHIAGGEFHKVHPMAGGSDNIDDIAHALNAPVGQMLDELAWWSELLRDARRQETAAAA